MLKYLTAIALIFTSLHSYALNFPAPQGDATPAFDAAVAQLCASPDDRELRLSAGRYVFNTAPQQISCAVTIEGQGKGATVLVRDYSASTFLYWTIGGDQGGGGVKNLNILSGPNTHGGIAIYVQAKQDINCNVTSYNRHSFTIDNVLIGRSEIGASDWYIPVYMDGSQNPGNNGCAPGLRGIDVFRTSVAAYTVGAFWNYAVYGAFYHDVDCYIPLNGAFAGIAWQASNSPYVVSRTCAFKSF